MSIKEDFYKEISNIIRNNYKWNKVNDKYQLYIDTKVISDLSKYFWNENLERVKKWNGDKLTFNSVDFVINSIPSLKENNKQPLEE